MGKAVREARSAMSRTSGNAQINTIRRARRLVSDG